MSFIFTYDSLVTRVQQQAQRFDDEFLENIPMFVTLGQCSLGRKLNILGTRRLYKSNLIPNSSVVPKPNMWLGNINFSINVQDPLSPANPTTFNTRVMLEQRSIEYLWYYWPNSGETGQPKYYASDLELLNYTVAPTPALAYPWEATYFAFPEGLGPNSQTNYFTLYAPDALFYEIMTHAGIFSGSERLSFWKNQAQEAIASISEQNLSIIYDAYGKRTA